MSLYRDLMKEQAANLLKRTADRVTRRVARDVIRRLYENPHCMPHVASLYNPVACYAYCGKCGREVADVDRMESQRQTQARRRRKRGRRHRQRARRR